MTGELGVLRRCKRCDKLRSIESFVPLGKLCRGCVKGKVASGSAGVVRGLVITEKGRATLRAIHAAESRRAVA